MRVKRGTGRAALIEATAEILRNGNEVQVKDVAAIAGVSHTLVYRHFPEGGKEELLAEGYAYLFRGLVTADTDQFFKMLNTQGLDYEAMCAFVEMVFSPRRADTRWLRLESLVQVRLNPFAESALEATRAELIHEFALKLREYEPRVSVEAAVALSIFTQALPLGVTAIGGPDLSKPIRARIAQMWTDTFLRTLLEAKT